MIRQRQPASYSETIVSCTLCIISILRKTVMRSWPALTSVLQKKCTARSPLFSAMWTAPLRPAIYQKITEDRSAQRYRTIPLDLFCDTEVIGNIISSPTSVVGFGPDGTLYTPGREVFRTPYNLFDQSLKELFTKAL